MQRRTIPLSHNRPLTIVLFLLLASAVNAQNSSFTYQGQLKDGGSLASGSYDMQFKLCDTLVLGTGNQCNNRETAGKIRTVREPRGCSTARGRATKEAD